QKFKSLAHQALHFLLQKCSSSENLKQLHAQLITHGLTQETLTIATLIAFTSLSDLSYARRAFNRVEKPNRFMYNTLIRAYSYTNNNSTEALVLHHRMMGNGILPNNFTFPFVLKVCANVAALKETRLIHGLIVKIGFESNVFVMNALLHAYSTGGSVWFASAVFAEMPERSVVSWNSMIDGYCRIGDSEKAYRLFVMMRELGLKPDGFALVSILSLSLQSGNLGFGRFVHWFVTVNGIEFDLILWNALLDMYGKCGELRMARLCFDRMPMKNVVSWTSLVCAHAKHGLIDLARVWFDRMPEKSIVSWNAMISCYIQHGLCRQGLELYSHMQNLRITPDENTLVNVLSACSQTGNLVIGEKTHDYIRGNIVDPSITLRNSIIDMHAKCGHVDVALNNFSTMKIKNLISWNIIIGALAMHGRGLDAVQLFECMVDEGFNPDRITFTGLLSGCNHAGLVEFGRYYFKSMHRVYKIPYEIEHYACMVDLLGRGGQFDEAVAMIVSMPMKPDVVIWGAMLGACRIQGNIVVGKQVMKHVLELETYNGGLYVLLSNMFYENQRWEDMKRLRKLMKERGIRKGKGRSSIEINGDVYEFMVEDTSHENSSYVHSTLDALTDHLMSLEWFCDLSVTSWQLEE
ncbi:pentatricopeptide repeat-containing protein At2g22410, mitochondrial-like, partial [Asparagus officinalis]|uniref:pentatricopeptide repeat-containing protein At2g22410, mitochondrial-like n=1 Tax=Asparagus officinalis TaxID=4686 RepID=UPI00098DEDDC